MSEDNRMVELLESEKLCSYGAKVISTAVKSVDEPCSSQAKSNFSYNWILFVGLLVLELAVAVWNSYDHSLPCWDTAAHRINSLAAYELFRHPHLDKLDWYSSLFTLSPLYPPLFYWLSGGLKLIFGPFAETERYANLIFVAVLYLSTYKLSLLLTGSRARAIFAALVLGLSPMIFWSSHCVLLDLATNAAVAAGLCALAWWDARPSYRRACVLGCVIGLAILTKHNTVGFFVGPLLLMTFCTIKDDRISFCSWEQSSSLLRQLILAGITAGLICLPWIIFDGRQVLEYIASIQNQTFGTQDRVQEFFENLISYPHEAFWKAMTPFLSVVFLGSLITDFWQRKLRRSQILMLSSIVMALLICSSFRWLFQLRYFSPATIPAFVIVANGFIDGWFSRSVLIRGALIVLLAATGFASFVLAYSPYPVRLPIAISDFMVTLPVFRHNSYTHSDTCNMGISIYPLPEQDWGMKWTLDQLEKSPSIGDTLMVMPNSDCVGASTLVYLCKKYGCKVNLKCSREYSVAGDVVTFDPEEAAEAASWYLLKSGNQGQQFADMQSQKQYDMWCSFVRKSPEFRLHAEKVLPDGSILSLYSKNPKLISAAELEKELAANSEFKNINFEKAVCLLGLSAIEKNEKVLLKTYWRAEDVEVPCDLAVHVIDNDDKIITQYDHALVGAQYKSGQIIRDTCKIDRAVLKRAKKLGLAVVRRGQTLLADRDIGDWGNHRLLLDASTLKPYRDERPFLSEAAVKESIRNFSGPQNIDFDGAITLMGLDTRFEGDTLQLRSFWRSTPATGTCRLAVHILDSGGNILKLYDHDLIDRLDKGGQYWSDSCKIDAVDLREPGRTIGIAVMKNGKTLRAQGKCCKDWGGHRLIVVPEISN